MDNEDRFKEARARIARHLYQSGEDAAELASQLHPDMAALDVRRFLSGAEPVCEDERVLSIETIMLRFAGSLRQ